LGHVPEENRDVVVAGPSQPGASRSAAPAGLQRRSQPSGRADRRRSGSTRRRIDGDDGKRGVAADLLRSGCDLHVRRVLDELSPACAEDTRQRLVLDPKALSGGGQYRGQPAVCVMLFLHAGSGYPSFRRRPRRWSRPRLTAHTNPLDSMRAGARTCSCSERLGCTGSWERLLSTARRSVSALSSRGL
jgi:hypothetical protein